MKKIPQEKLKSYYRNALTLAGVNADQSMARDWFIRHRTAPVEAGAFRLAVTKVPTVSVNFSRLRYAVNRMNPALRAKIKNVLRRCVTKGSTFRVEVKATRG